MAAIIILLAAIVFIGLPAVLCLDLFRMGNELKKLRKSMPQMPRANKEMSSAEIAKEFEPRMRLALRR